MTSFYHNGYSGSTRPLVVIERCPSCERRLVVRTNRQTGDAFIGCSGYPRCRFTEPLIGRINRMAARITELEYEMAGRHERPAANSSQVLLAKELRSLIAHAHPDRWPDNPLAHQITSELTRLRDLVRAAV